MGQILIAGHNLSIIFRRMRLRQTRRCRGDILYLPDLGKILLSFGIIKAKTPQFLPCGVIDEISAQR